MVARTWLQMGKHCSGTRKSRRASSEDPRGWKGAKSEAITPTGDDTAIAMTMNGAASIAGERAFVEVEA
jgi:hypothetical protein